MSRHIPALALSILVLGFVAVAAAIGQPEDPVTADTPESGGDVVERGRYLATGIGMCGECHTPRNASGELQTDRWLKGAPIPVGTPEGYETWAYKAPRIAGLPQHTDDEFVRLMTTGVNRDDKPTRFPMPQFRMTEEDALAIAAYLRSLD